MRKLLLTLLFLIITVLFAYRVQISGKMTAAAEPQPQPASAVADAVKADPKHYKVEFENDSIRVLRATYGPYEKSPMHHHPAVVIVSLTDGRSKEILPDGKSSESKSETGAVSSAPATTHSVENLDNRRFESILIELKGKDKPK